MKTLAIATAVWAATVLSSSSLAQTPAKSVNQGVYTADQADRGAATFKTRCMSCHETARFTGTDFLAVWTGKPLHELFDLMHKTMPEDNPGSLEPQQYADVVAYFLKLNDYPAGQDELQGTPEAMKAIAFDKKGK
jgi:S-disulfanyl-L-cysteine oxidoreductase SoxD